MYTHIFSSHDDVVDCEVSDCQCPLQTGDVAQLQGH